MESAIASLEELIGGSSGVDGKRRASMVAELRSELFTTLKPRGDAAPHGSAIDAGHA